MQRSVLKYFAGGLIVLGSVAPSHAQQNVGRFPFVMPWNDAAKTVTDVSFLNPAPLTNQHRVGVKNGRFIDGTGRRVRFLGTNFGTGANFPRKEDAAQVAARLHKLGFNAVRLHHMDAPWGNPNIFGKDRDNYNSINEEIDRESLDRLDYLVYQLKQHGIYVNLNLHVSWAPSAAAGYPDTDNLPELGKTTAYFEKRSIEHQKHYARQFMTHVNPYTKMTWAADPAVAMVELNNEDSIIGQAYNDVLLNLPPYYRDQLQAKWNTFLRRKYTSTAALKRAWTGGRDLGPNILQDAQFNDNTTGWALEKQQGELEWTIEDVAESTSPRPNGRALHVTVKQIGDAAWRQQVHQNGLNLEEGELYTIQFWAKADKNRAMSAYAALDQAPWSNVGVQRNVQLTAQWQKFTLMLRAKGTVPNHNRLSFIMGEGMGEVWLADVSIQKGLLVELEPNQTLESDSIPLTRGADTPQGSDYIAFLIDVERQYVETMRDYIKNDLKSQSLVTCSQAWLGGIGGVLRESRTDWVDMHAYWQHPEFPNKPWDQKDWRIPNTSMVREGSGGTIPQLALHRVADKPFTVTEYNSPAPNDYASETMPLICAYAAWQDWDGIFLFGYYGDDENWNSDRIRNFFDADTDPNKMATMPAAALMFLGNQIAPVSGRQSTLVVPRGSVVPAIAQTGLGGFWDSNVATLWRNAGGTRADWLQSKTAIQLTDGGGPIRLQRTIEPQTGAAQTGADAVQWQTSTPDTALFTVNSPRAKAAIGFLGGGWTQLGELVVTMDKTTRNFVTLALTPRDNRPVLQSRSLLLTALSNVENTGMGWNETRTSVGDQWGTGPALAEGIPANVQLKLAASKASVYALDPTGKRTQQVPSQMRNNVLSFRIEPRFQTLWYEIVAG